jgi:DnaK suppressor protein
MMLKKSFIKKIQESLVQEKRQLIIRTCQEQNIEVDTDGDEFDEVQGNLLIEMHNQLNTRNAQKILQIDDALERINKKTYGACEDCGEDIPEKRLLFNPYAPTCVDCAEDRELEEKQRKKEQA